MSSPVFISYRRSDSQHATARLVGRMAPRFLAPAEIFMDVEAIAAGADFLAVLEQHLRQCKICLVVIGRDWLARDGNGKRRIDDPADIVRQEVATVLERSIRVVPVLVDDAEMPKAADLPHPLKALATRNAVRLAHGRFNQDADELAATVLRTLGRSPDLELDILKLLFSFRGTIDRKGYWLGLGATAVAQLSIWAAVMWSLGIPLGQGLRNPVALTMQQKVLAQLAMAWCWWPVLALSWKRIKDLGHGWGLFVPVMAASVAQISADILGQNTVADQLALVVLICLVALGVLKGTRFIAHSV